METISVGTYGYDYPQWSGSFYDPDLPPDWRFLHYCNQFRAVMLPFDATDAFLDGRLPELLADSDDAFRFVVEIKAGRCREGQVVEGLSPLGERLAGVVVRVDNRPGSSIDALEAAILPLDRRWPVCLDFVGGDGIAGEPLDGLGRARGWSTLWRPERSPRPVDPGRIVVCRMPGTGLKRVRQVLEQLAQFTESGTRAGLFFDEIDVAPESARQCRLVAELMGL